jgi:hypothetical protein
MRTQIYGLMKLVPAIIVPLAPAPQTYAKDARLLIRVHPCQAYLFVAGVGKGDASCSGNRTLLLRHTSPGEHTIAIYDYGYTPVTRQVTVSEGQTSTVNISMESVPGTVSGPWKGLKSEGGGHAAALLNGKTPDYYVGEAGDFNDDTGWGRNSTSLKPRCAT